MNNPAQVSPSSIERQKQVRYYALDATRAIALLFGIFFHGAHSFVTWMPDMVWAVKENQGSMAINLFFYISHVFRMPAFFLMSGFFAHMLFHRWGQKGFLTHRYKRIAVPFLFFWPIMFFLIQALWLWGYRQMGYFAEIPEINSLGYWELFIGHIFSFAWLEGGIPLSHLWFLYVLFLFCVGILPLRYLVVKWIDGKGKLVYWIDNIISHLMHRWYGSLVLGIYVILPMLGMQNGFGVDTPDHGFVPHWASFMVYAFYFGLGWFLHRQPDLIVGFRKFWKVNLLIGSILIGIVSWMFHTTIIGWIHSGDPEAVSVQSFMDLYNAIYALAAMSSVFAFTGMMMALFSKKNKNIRYMSDASYWMYIAHLPLVILLQIALVSLPWHWIIKLAIIYISCFTILFVTYHFWVRNTWIGVMLNGRKMGK